MSGFGNRVAYSTLVGNRAILVFGAMLKNQGCFV